MMLQIFSLDICYMYWFRHLCRRVFYWCGCYRRSCVVLVCIMYGLLFVYIIKKPI